jgi:SAM-dependent methyltransferase
MIKYYDKNNNRLVYVGQIPDSKFWDNHWQVNGFENRVNYNYKNMTKYIKKYLPSGSRILEGGCGSGDKVYIMQNEGYNPTGIDFAKKTVQYVKKIKPELRVFYCDVRNLSFVENSFDGYCSFGIIEHFYNGYEIILKEIHRVLNNNGILYLSVPSMSFIRKMKAKLGRYPRFNDKINIDDFYQFVYDPKSIISNFSENGFVLLKHKKHDALKGIGDEIKIFKSLIEHLNNRKSFISKAIIKSVSLLGILFGNHLSLFVFKKI